MKTLCMLVLFLPCYCFAMGMDPIDLGEPFQKGWVPDGEEPLRGVLVLDGYKFGHEWKEAAWHWRYAIIRSASYGYTPSDAKGREGRLSYLKAALEHAIAELAQRTGRKELLTAPIISSGYSRFSGWGSHQMVAAFPERVVAHISGFGPNGAYKERNKDQAVAWERYPNMFLATENEDIWKRGGFGETLVPNQWRRQPQVLRMMHMTWGTYHDPYNYHDLGMIFIDRAIAHRVPADWNPLDGAPTLKPMDPTQAWLGSHARWTDVLDEQLVGPGPHQESPAIAPIASFAGDASQASWIMDEQLAYVWRGMATARPKVQITAPSHGSMPHVRTTLHLERSLFAGESFTFSARALVENVCRVDFFANNVQVASAETFQGGDMALGSTRDAFVTTTAALPAGIYGITARYTLADGSQGWSWPAVVVVHAKQ